MNAAVITEKIVACGPARLGFDDGGKGRNGSKDSASVGTFEFNELDLIAEEQ